MKKKYCFKNISFNKQELQYLIRNYYFNYGISKTNCLLDSLKDLGFYFATKASISLSIEDLKIPPTKSSLIGTIGNEINITYLKKVKGHISEIERLQKFIDLWNSINLDLKNEVVKHFKLYDSLNPIYLMAFSGARGNLSQVHQLVGMRGLMADPSGQILEIPIQSNFREGLKITDYIISSYGARKGIVDTALKTADSGYLTRRLVDVAHYITIKEIDCKTNKGILIKDSNINSSYLIGRLVINKPEENFKFLMGVNNEITQPFINFTKNLLRTDLIIKSPLTCISSRAICQKCYGWNVAHMNLVEIGEAVGIIAAQSIGEPGTQLTMRTFHTGGVISSDSRICIYSKASGKIVFSTSLKTFFNRTIYGEETLEINNCSKIYIIQNLKSIVKFKVFENLLLFINNYQIVKEGMLLAEIPILNNESIKATTYIKSDLSGEIKYQNIRVNLFNGLYMKSLKNGIIWILAGNLIIFPKNALLNIKKNSYFLKNNNLFSLKVINKQNGILKIQGSNLFNEKLIILDCSFIFELSYIFKNEQNLNFVFYIFTKSGILFNLKKDPYFNILRITSKYDIKISGKLYNIKSNNFNKNKYRISKLLIIPIENYLTKTPLNNLRKKKYGKYIFKNTVLIKNFYSINEGILIISKLKSIGYNVLIISGKLDKIIQTNKLLNKNLCILECFYNGETLFNILKLKKLIKININSLKKISKKKYIIELFYQPIIQCAIKNTKKFNLQFLTKNEKKILIYLQSNTISSSNYLLRKSLKTIKISIVLNNLLLEASKHLQTRLNYQLYYIKNPINFNFVNLVFSIFEEIKFITNTHYLTRLNSIQINFLIKKNQFIESYSTIAIISSISSKLFFTNQFKSNLIIKNKFLYTSTNSYFSNVVSLGYDIKNFKKKFLKKRIGQPYFISKGTTLYVKHGDFIEKSKLLCLLVYDKIITGDIIQGLPKIEHILESRVPKYNSSLAIKPSIIINCKFNCVTTIDKQNKYCYPNLENLNKKLYSGDFIYVGQPLEIGPINPHNLLAIYFGYYITLFNLNESVNRSLILVQIVLINSIQSVYKSQGVKIADKHIELIIKQMSSKVQITKTTIISKILPGELINRQQINYINKALLLEKQQPMSYKPVLFGITRTALIAESFLSAASFQETTKILISAAQEGKIDWLSGLKENVIVGNLAPIGTGMCTFTEMANLKVLY